MTVGDLKMTKKLLIAAALSATSILAMTQTAKASTPQISFDCGEISTSQLIDLQAKTDATGLKNLAKQCDQQAEDYEMKAKDALQANDKADVSFLREKAANAYMNVAVFTNSSLFKN
jgi:hypothetical protein